MGGCILILDSRYWILDTGYWILDTRYSMSKFGPDCYRD